MRLVSLELESRLRDKGVWPESRTAKGGVYVLALAVLFFALQLVSAHLYTSLAKSLSGWVSFLSGLAIFLFAIVGFRWLRSQMLWRLRNRLIVTYMFIGVIPVILLVLISGITLYLLAWQFAGLVVRSEITSHLSRMEATNREIANELAMHLSGDGALTPSMIADMRARGPDAARGTVCAWYGNPTQPVCSGPAGAAVFEAPAWAKEAFREIVRDQSVLYLRTATVVKVRSETLRVISSEPFDKTFLGEIAAGLGEITVGMAHKEAATEAGQNESKPIVAAQDQNKRGIEISRGGQSGIAVSDNGHRLELDQTLTAGNLRLPSSALDREFTFPAPLQIIEWPMGEPPVAETLLARIQTRPSILYDRLFEGLGDLARGVEYILLVVAIVFAIIELLALFIGTRLTRSITSAVAQLYEATKHINRADFSHRIAVKSDDQLATLANSFNSMTASIEKLVLDQKEKQRLENELAIAQEVQATLFPQKFAQLESLEVHGFCRPARTVSGDYYDFLALNSDKLILAVGDVSGKGISAALLMATIHSAVRAYSLEGVPLLREPMAVGVAGGADLVLASEIPGAEVSPATLLGLLNHQLYESTPQEKYATLFLAIYDGATQRLVYSNGGHLPPILLSEDGSSQLLTCGGTVAGLFPDVRYPEATVQLRRGDVLIGYSDGVTEPENDYGEFGEQRLIELVRENRHLPLARITEIVTAAVDDWIGDNEQPDDVTLVLARAR